MNVWTTIGCTKEYYACLVAERHLHPLSFVQLVRSSSANLLPASSVSDACGVSTTVAMAWVEEKLHASDLIRQLSAVADTETNSVVHDSTTVSVFKLSAFPCSYSFSNRWAVG